MKFNLLTIFTAFAITAGAAPVKQLDEKFLADIHPLPRSLSLPSWSSLTPRSLDGSVSPSVLDAPEVLPKRATGNSLKEKITGLMDVFAFKAALGERGVDGYEGLDLADVKKMKRQAYGWSAEGQRKRWEEERAREAEMEAAKVE